MKDSTIAAAIMAAHHCRCPQCREELDVLQGTLGLLVDADRPNDSGRASDELPRTAEEHAP